LLVIVCNTFMWEIEAYDVITKDWMCEAIVLIHKIPLYIILLGSVKGTRSEILFSPILSDQFGFAETEIVYVFLSYSVVQVIGSLLV